MGMVGEREASPKGLMGMRRKLKCVDGATVAAEVVQEGYHFRSGGRVTLKNGRVEVGREGRLYDFHAIMTFIDLQIEGGWVVLIYLGCAPSV